MDSINRNPKINFGSIKTDLKLYRQRKVTAFSVFAGRRRLGYVLEAKGGFYVGTPHPSLKSATDQLLKENLLK